MNGARISWALVVACLLTCWGTGVAAETAADHPSPTPTTITHAHLSLTLPAGWQRSTTPPGLTLRALEHRDNPLSAALAVASADTTTADAWLAAQLAASQEAMPDLHWQRLEQPQPGRQRFSGSWRFAGTTWQLTALVLSDHQRAALIVIQAPQQRWSDLEAVIDATLASCMLEP